MRTTKRSGPSCKNDENASIHPIHYTHVLVHHRYLFRPSRTGVLIIRDNQHVAGRVAATAAATPRKVPLNQIKAVKKEATVATGWSFALLHLVLLV